MLVALPLGVCYIMDRTKVTAKRWAHLEIDIVELVLKASLQKVQVSVELEFGWSSNRLVQTHHSKCFSSPSDCVVLFVAKEIFWASPPWC